MTNTLRMASLRHRAVLITLLMALTNVQGLFKEQAGKYDWIKQNVGTIKFARFNQESQILVASHQGAIAAISTVYGSLHWRHLLDEGESIVSLELTPSTSPIRAVAILTASSRLLMFNSAHGQLLWEISLPNKEEGGFLDCVDGNQADIAMVQDGSAVVVACGNSVAGFSISNGHRRWKTDGLYGEDNDAINNNPTKVHCGSNKTVTVARVASGSVLRIAIVQASDGSLQSTRTAQPASNLLAHSLIALDGSAAVVSGNGKVCFVRSNPSSSMLTCLGVSKDLGLADNAAAIVLRKDDHCASAFSVVHSSDSRGGSAAAIVTLGGDENGGLEVVTKDTIMVAVACLADSPNTIHATISASMSSDGLRITHKDYRDNMMTRSRVSTELLRTNSVTGAVLAGISSAFLSSHGNLLIQLEEDSLALIALDNSADNGSTISPSWVRYEALAQPLDFLFADLPAPTPENEAEWAASQPSLPESLHMQFVTLKEQIGLAAPDERAAVERYRAITSDRLQPTRDPDGFRRQIIMATGVGKVISMHTGDGRVLWSVDLGSHHHDASKKNTQDFLVRLGPWNTPHDIHQDARIALFTASHHTTEKDSMSVTVINTRTGEVESTHKVPGGADITAMPHVVHHDKADQHMYAVLDAQNKVVGVLPEDSEEVRARYAQQAQHAVRWDVTDDGTSLSGFGPDAVPLWKVVVAPKDSGMRILSIASRDQDESVYSAARPLPGGGIILKHVSPNTLLVVVGHEDPFSPSSRIIAYIVDATTGNIFYSQVHKAASGPVHSIASEHWVAYHYWNVETERWEISVLDGYHTTPEDLDVIDLMMDSAKAANLTAAAVIDTLPMYERQVFNVRMATSTLGVTKTAHGTTAKMLLIGTPRGQVYMMDRRLLDPRRPVVATGAKPTPAQMSEGLPPYQPELPIAGPLYATLDHKIGRLQKIKTAPAVLESASLLVAVGFDTFYARLQPSKGFDMVPDDFPHALLVAMVAGMGIALVVLRVVLQQKAIKMKWQ